MLTYIEEFGIQIFFFQRASEIFYSSCPQDKLNMKGKLMQYTFMFQFC